MISISHNPNQDELKAKLEELKEVWNKHWQNDDRLDSKAASVIQVAGTITTLIFGFVTFSQLSGNKLSFIPLTQGIIIASIFFCVGSIILSIFAVRLRSLLFPLDVEDYFRNTDYTRIRYDADRFYHEKLREPYDYESLIKNYLMSLLTFTKNNQSKSRFLVVAMILLVIGIALTVAAVIAIFWSQSSLSQQQGNGELTCKQLSTIETRIINGTNIFASSSNKESKVMLCMSK